VVDGALERGVDGGEERLPSVEERERHAEEGIARCEVPRAVDGVEDPGVP
jgi:hypothetical protein